LEQFGEALHGGVAEVPADAFVAADGGVADVGAFGELAEGHAAAEAVAVEAVAEAEFGEFVRGAHDVTIRHGASWVNI